MDEQYNQIKQRLEAIQQTLLQQNGWGEWGKKVLSDLEEFQGRIEAVEDHVGNIREDIAVIKTKLDDKVNKEDFTELRTEMKARAGLIGVLTGAIPAIGILIWNFLKS